MKDQADALRCSDKAKPSPTATPSQTREQTGNFPYPVGVLVKVAFPELFRRKLLSAGDIAYLLSKKAAKDFRTRGNPVLKMYAGEEDPGLYANDHRRFYKIRPLELGSKKYHLSSQFYPESREAVLKWVYARGFKKADLVALIQRSTEQRHAGPAKTKAT